MLESCRVTCPNCWESIELLVDLSGGDSVYTEDCPVCCQPMQVRLRVGGGDLRHEATCEPKQRDRTEREDDAM